MQNPFNPGPFSVRIDPSQEIVSRAWQRRPGQRLVRVSPIPGPTPVSRVNHSISSDSVFDSDLAEIADDIVNETGFSAVQIRTISKIIVAALAQDRVQNQVPPTSSNQPVVEEREILEPTSDNQASAGNTVPVDNDLIKQLAELKDKVEKMSVEKEKDLVTNFHMNRYDEEDVLRTFPQTSYKNYRTRYDGPNLGIQKAGLNFEKLYNEKEKKSRGFDNHRSSHSGHDKNVGNAATNQSGSSKANGAVNRGMKREFTDLGRPLSTVMRSCIENGILLKLPINPSRLILGKLVDQDCEWDPCDGPSTDNCFRLKHDIQVLIDSGKITKPPERSQPTPGNH
ncbi:hypothetical protein JCGZ_19141 [Jatropha curcas]|uniref:Uncharacterized protein n=1 Tax=Jatropha curcas TaxID=180498 RepID=A0A067KCQ1_JATCU|nr:hypothetical protein JCGZ_19141 [Jatropha curcas]